MGDTFEQKLEDSLTYQIDYTANFNKSFRRAFQNKNISTELTPDEFFILYIIKHEPHVSQASIARALFKGKAHVGKILNELEKKEYIQRESMPNSTATYNKLLPKGEAVIDKGRIPLENSIKVLEKAFTKEELSLFISFLKRYRESLGSIITVKLK